MTPRPPGRRPAYAKPWLSYADQVAQLASRGLVVNDPAAARAFLSHVNYYRFSGYCLAFEKQRHAFNEGVTFEQVRVSYEFDLALRDLVTEALEVLEVDFRAAVAYHFGQRHGAFGHVDPRKFYRLHDHAEWLQQLRDEADRSKEQFIEHFRKTYDHIQIFRSGSRWRSCRSAHSKMYKGMLRPDQRDAERYGINPGTWSRRSIIWSMSETCVRTTYGCGIARGQSNHRCRGGAWRPPHLPSNDRLFATLLLMYDLMSTCPAVRTFAAVWPARGRRIDQSACRPRRVAHGHAGRLEKHQSGLRHQNAWPPGGGEDKIEVNTMAKTKLELTWIGKENRPKLEPRVLLENPEEDYHALDRSPTTTCR